MPDRAPAAPAVAATDAAEEPAVKATSQTAGLLQRFRPGQSLDDELAAFERERSGAEGALLEAAGDQVIEAVAEPVRAVAEVEPVAEEPVEAAARPSRRRGRDAASRGGGRRPIGRGRSRPWPRRRSSAAEAGRGRRRARRGRGRGAEAETVAEADRGQSRPRSRRRIESRASRRGRGRSRGGARRAGQPAGRGRAVADDRVEQPTWRVTAPETHLPPSASPTPGEPATPPPRTASSIPAAEPQWPPKPEWPAPQASIGLPFLGRPVQPRGWRRIPVGRLQPRAGRDAAGSGPHGQWDPALHQLRAVTLRDRPVLPALRHPPGRADPVVAAPLGASSRTRTQAAPSKQRLERQRQPGQGHEPGGQRSRQRLARQPAVARGRRTPG